MALRSLGRAQVLAPEGVCPRLGAISWPGSWPSPINGSGQTGNSGDASLEFLHRLQGEQAQAGSLCAVTVGVCPGAGSRRGFGAPPTFVAPSAAGHAQYPNFAPDAQLLLPALQKWQLGFVYFVSFGPELAPTAHAH